MFYVTGTETVLCPKCLGTLRPYDRRRRSVINHEGFKKAHKLRRLRCENCLSLHVELPGFMIPYKRHSSAVVESVISGEKPGVPFEERTGKKIKAWYKKIESHLKGIFHQRLKLGFASPSVVPCFLVLVKVAVNSGNWPCHPFGHFRPAI